MMRMQVIQKSLVHKTFQNPDFANLRARIQGSSQHAIDMTPTQADMDSSLPSWFLDNCVKTAQDLANSDVPLIIRENAMPGHDHNRGKTDSDANVYEIDSAVYEPLQRLFSPEIPNTVDERLSDSHAAPCFSKDRVHLSLPRKHGTSDGSQFLTAVVEYFAKNAGADMITLALDDIEVLIEQQGLMWCPLAEIDTTVFETSEEQLARHDHTIDDCESQNRETAHDYEPHALSLTHLLSSPGVKLAIRQIQSRSSKWTPCVVHLPKFKSLLDVYKIKFIEELRGALREVTPNGLIISTSTTFEFEFGDACTTFDDESDLSEKDILEQTFGRDGLCTYWHSPLSNTKILQTTGLDPKTQLIRLVPSNSRTQRLLFDKHRKHDSSNERENIRLLQNSIRKLPIELHKSSILQPYADWNFLNGTPALEKLVKHVLNQDELDGIIRDLRYEPTVGHAGERGTANGQVTDAKIKEVILTFGCRVKALEKWSDSVEDESKWSTFPSQAQATIREIQDDDSFEWEQKFLDLLINPNDVEEGWSEIALEPDIKEAIQQLIHQPTNTGKHSYGILKRARIGGALLYGPPGTGKTHLARVLARESKAITICASAADLINSYVGETEKAIHALFNLGRRLSPCTIFLDEADALFRSRKPDDKSWERNQVNQLLHEMDGLKKLKSSPFVLLATNFPHDLDIAVLRRVPSRIHIGLPSSGARHQIFQICLADEKLHSNIDLRRLAEISQGYSGSDIQMVCVQAALICDAVTDVDARRVLMSTHFDKAFQRCAPTVSKTALTMIKAFSREYNPAALERTEQLGKTGPLPNITSQLLYDEVKKTDGGDDLPQKHIKMPPIGTVEEIENDASGTGYSELQGSYRYSPLQPDSMQMRVLSFLPRGNKPDGFLRCKLRTVDLNDWTTDYREVSSQANDSGVPNLPKLRLTVWCHVSSFRRGDRKFNYSGSDRFTKKGFEEFLTKIRLRDFPPEETHEIRHRFIWGDYVALSYVWGDVADKQDILLNDHRFPVTKSLYEALSHLRDAFEVHKTELHVWADAVCINQDDLEERAREIKKMGAIYSRCSSVRAWLGDHTPAIARELPSVRNFLSLISDADLNGLNKSVFDRITSFGAAHSIKVVSSGLTSSLFWERLWTVQEVALPPRILFHWGKEAFRTEDVMKLCLVSMHLVRGDYDIKSGLGNTHTLYRLHGLRPLDDQDYVVRVGFNLVDVVGYARMSKSKDPRDKVFGLLALLPDSLADRIEPNYDPSFSTQDTYIMFFKSCYEVAGNLNSLARFIMRPSLTPNLPSWALDLGSENLFTDRKTNMRRNRDHKANLGLVGKQLTFGENDRLLLCEGVMVDAVASLGAVEISDSASNFQSQPRCEISNIQGTSPASKCDWKLALARVLTKDSSYEFSESPFILDFRWPDLGDLREEMRHYQSFDYDRQYLKWDGAGALEVLLSGFLHGNEDFDIGGKPLRDFFASSTGKVCPGTHDNYALIHELFGQRLCKTETGLLGTAPYYARLGDKIAILSNCDMPMVLRPNGQHYEVVGGCFVEGLMRGEAAEGIKQGLYQMETFSLC